MNNQKFLRVIDASCTEESKERTHEIVVHGETIPVKFKFGEDTVLPFEQGIKFMVDGFKVEEVDGTSLVLPVVASDSVKSSLEKDECVAKYVELTLASLRLRAAQRPGGEMYIEAGEEDKANIIAFLIGEPPVEVLAADAFIDGEDTLIADDDETPKEGSSDFHIRFGCSFTDLMTAFYHKYGAVSYSAHPNNSEVFDLIGVDGGVVISGTLEALVKGEGNPPKDTPAPDDQLPPTEPESLAGTTPPAGDATFTLGEINAATDEALNLAVQYGVDIKTIVGTGENGNVLKGDVQSYIDANNLVPVPPQA